MREQFILGPVVPAISCIVLSNQNCQELESCARAGLHCHHPRNCLYFLRNEEVDRLQRLLQVCEDKILKHNTWKYFYVQNLNSRKGRKVLYKF